MTSKHKLEDLLTVDLPKTITLPDVLIYAYPDHVLPKFKTYSLEGLLTHRALYNAVSFVVAPMSWNIHHFDSVTYKAGGRLDRASEDVVTPGCYIIISDPIATTPIYTTFKPTSSRAAKAALPGSAASENSRKSQRDASSAWDSFKNRLIKRDGTCVICHAAGVKRAYNDGPLGSLLYEGAHIVALEYYALWDSSYVINDPFTDPERPSRKRARAPRTIAVPTPEDNRMNSLENGLLLCVEHHKMYDHSGFAIHPKTHEIFALAPECASLHGKIVTKPWEFTDLVNFPPPGERMLRTHCEIAVYGGMRAAAEDELMEYDTDSDMVEDVKIRAWDDEAEIESPSSRVLEYVKDNSERARQGGFG